MEAGVGREDESGAESVNEVRVMGMHFSRHSGNQHSLRGKDEWVGTSSLLFIMVEGLTSQSLNHPLMKTQRVFSDPNKNPPERRERITNKANQVPRLHIQPCTERQQNPILCMALQQTTFQSFPHLYSQRCYLFAYD